MAVKERLIKNKGLVKLSYFKKTKRKLTGMGDARSSQISLI
jgi:hypothetical protein